MKWLLRLYPRAWRRRYGEEFMAVLEETPTTPRVLADCLLGAVDAHLRPQAAPAEQPAATPSPPAEVAPPAIVPPRRRVPRPEAWEGFMDRVIREAEERGEFDNLPGAGKPLNLDDDPLAGEWAMAYRIVRQAGETLPWIALGREIDADRRQLQAALDATAARLRRLRLGAGGDPGRYAAERDRERTRYLAAAAELDTKLDEFNRQVPSWRLDRGRFPPRLAAERFDAACPPSDAARP